MGAEASINEALCVHLRDMSLGYPVQWPNTTYAPVTDRPWVRVALLRAPPFQAALGDGGANRHRGVFQVSIFWPAGEGAHAPVLVAEQIAARFKRGTTLVQDGVEVRIITPPYVGRPVDEPGWTQIPVSVNYFADAPN